MPLAAQDHPKIILYPSSQEDASAYMTAIRLASAVRNSMDAQKAGAAGKDGAIDEDSSGRHYPDAPAPVPANLTTPGTVPTLNQTSSAHFISNITKPGFVPSPVNYPSPSNSTDTAKTPTGADLEAEEENHGDVAPLIHPIGIDTEDAPADSPTVASIEAEKQHRRYFPPSIASVGTDTEDSVADTHTSVTIEALEEHHGRFPPPEPPIGATPAPPAKPVLGRAVPMPIEINFDTLRAKLDVPNGVPPKCQIYATRTDIHTPFAVCPVNKPNSDLSHDLTSRRHSQDAPHSHIFAIRNTAVCEAPTDFHQRLVCGRYNGCFALGFILFSIICLAWILKVRKQRTHRFDEENGAAIGAGLTHVPLGKNSDAKYSKDVMKAHQDWHHVGGDLGTEQYQPVAWRSSSLRAARANIGGKVEHDAGPVAGLPGIYPFKGV